MKYLPKSFWLSFDGVDFPSQHCCGNVGICSAVVFACDSSGLPILYRSGHCTTSSFMSTFLGTCLALTTSLGIKSHFPCLHGGLWATSCNRFGPNALASHGIFSICLPGWLWNLCGLWWASQFHFHLHLLSHGFSLQVHNNQAFWEWLWLIS